MTRAIRIGSRNLLEATSKLQRGETEGLLDRLDSHRGRVVEPLDREIGIGVRLKLAQICEAAMFTNCLNKMTPKRRVMFQGESDCRDCEDSVSLLRRDLRSVIVFLA